MVDKEEREEAKNPDITWRGEASTVKISTVQLYPDKLTGYEWYESIGSPKYVVAPMVDASELAYRQLVRRYGATLVYTQMFNSNVFCEDAVYRKINWQTCKGDRPLIVQFAGNDPLKLLRSAKIVENDCDAVDLNLGCPQGIAKRGKYGAFLMEELELLHSLVSTLALNLKVPVTCKTRIYRDDFDRTIRLCETLVNAGASLLTIHGRTRDEKGQAIRDADWQMLRRIKEHFHGRVPVIANGGIRDMDDVNDCLAFTGCDGVMTSEGILENPSLFTRNIRYEDPPEAAGQAPATAVGSTCGAEPTGKVPVKYVSQLDLTDEYLDICRVHTPYHFRTIRSHMQKFLHRYLQNHTDLRDMLTQSFSIDEFKNVVAQTRAALQPRGSSIGAETRENTAVEEQDADEDNPLQNSQLDAGYADTTWYMRHRMTSTSAFSGRDENASKVAVQLTSKCNILETEETDGDYCVFSIFEQ